MPGVPRTALIVAGLAASALAACEAPMSDREYCTRRAMGWEMAFPNLSLSEAERARTIDRCVANVAAHPAAELAHSIDCMRAHLKGHGHAYEQFVAFTGCEGVDPSREPTAAGSQRR